MRAIVRGFLFVAVILAAPVAAHAQASVAGTVRDTSGAVLPGVTVEAASDVLIERVRTTQTDGTGRFQLVDLRPGNYVVTFTLAGFNTTRREGVQLTGSSVVAVDAEMRLGALEETVTVTSESPLVDVQSVTRQQILTSDAIQALPTARNYVSLARIVPGTVGGGNDVGGSALQDVGATLTIHGSYPTDQRITLNGVSVMTLQAGGGLGGQQPDVGSAAEVAVDTSSLSADLPTGGLRINFIPRDGGNTFHNATFLTFANKDLQGTNYSDELRAAGLPTPNRLVHAVDLSEAFGGPFRRDRLWFWLSTRFNDVASEAPIFRNANAYDPTKWLYAPDESRPGVNEGDVQQSSLRVTWQVNARNKIAGTYKVDRWCQCPTFIAANRAPEAAADRRFPRLRQEHVEWTSPLTNRLMVEAVAMHLYERWGNMHLRANGGSLDDPREETAAEQMISVLEQSSGLTYRGWTTFNNTAVPNYAYRTALAYVTGAHAFKTGFNRTHGYQEQRTYNFQPYSYRFNNEVPNLITLYATPYTARNHLDNDLGVYAQDRWTWNRSTINLALRFDYFATSFPEQRVGPGPLVPGRDLTFTARDNTSWKDLTYRTGWTYDVRGDGKTAIKASFNKYLLGQTLNGLGSSPNPVNTLVVQATRTWNNAARDYVPKCDLLNPAANGECGPTTPSTFGTAVPGALFDPDLLTGWGHRQFNYELSLGAQHEVLPRVSVDVGYFRRIWGNFPVVKNQLVTPDDFTRFTLTVPTDSRLPNGGGNAVTLYDIRPEKFGQVQNYNTLSDRYGKQIEHWNGVDVNVAARLRNGLLLQGGVSTGKTTEDNCEIVARAPEMLNIAPAIPIPGIPPTAWRPAEYCHRESPFLTLVKTYGVYTIPHVDVQIAGTFRSTPGLWTPNVVSAATGINAYFVATQNYVAANSTLGRPLSGGPNTNMTVGLVPPLTMYLDRRNELDIRIGKVLRAGRSRTVVSLDLYNLFNTIGPVAVNQNYGSFLAPTEVLNPRLAKISVQFDFGSGS